jgi:hypothetical protein
MNHREGEAMRTHPRQYHRPGVIILLLGIIVLGFTVTAPAGEWLPLSGPRTEDPPAVTVTAADRHAVELEVEIPGLSLESVVTPGGDYPILALPGEGFTAGIGRPQLPVMIRWVEIPAGAEAELEIVEERSETIALSDLGIDEPIAPAQAPVPKVPGARERAEFQMDDEVYSADRYEPQEIARLGPVDETRGLSRVQVQIYPVRYNASQEKVSVCSALRLKIHLRGADLEETTRRARRWRHPVFDRSLKRTLLNRGRYTEKDVPALPIGYLIITDDGYYDEMLPLAEWKEQKGFEVTVTRTSQISPSTASGIKAYIENAYNTWPVPPLYVLLVGDVGDIPAFSGSSSSTETDLPYSDMTGTYLPELRVGRFSVSSTTEAAAVVGKTLDYERTDLSTLDWFDDAVFMASQDNYTVSEGTHNWVISNYMDPNGYTSNKIYARLGGGTSDITANINAGRSIANYSGHGSQTSWYNPGFGISNINALTNTDQYPFVISNACLTTDIGYSECYGEHWVNVTAKGAIAHWGSSNLTYWTEDDILEKRMYRAIFDDQIHTLAGFTDQAKYYHYQYWGGSGMSRYYYECYILLGDPSLELPTDIPASLSVTHPATVPAGATTKVLVDVFQGGSALEDALVCLLQEGGFQQAAYTGTSGQAALYITPFTTDTILVTVTAHNGRPYQGSIVPVDDVPPAAVSDLQTYLAGSGLQLVWSAVTTDTLNNPKSVSGYAVYRDETGDFEPTAANSLFTVAGTEYLDAAAAVGNTAVQHFYKVIALGSGGLKSEPSRAAGEFDRSIVHESGQPKNE